PETAVLTLSYKPEGCGLQLWTPEMGRCDPLASLAADPGTVFICFAGFELAVWQKIMVERFDFAPIPIARWIDAQAECSYFALPRSLKKVLRVIGAPIVKDEAGARLVRRLSKRDRKTGEYPEVTTEILDRVAAYNKIDVEGLIAVHAALWKLPQQERKIWELDQAINRRGLGIDVELVRAAKQISETSMTFLRNSPRRPAVSVRTRSAKRATGFPGEGLASKTCRKTLFSPRSTS